MMNETRIKAKIKDPHGRHIWQQAHLFLKAYMFSYLLKQIAFFGSYAHFHGQLVMVGSL